MNKDPKKSFNSNSIVGKLYFFITNLVYTFFTATHPSLSTPPPVYQLGGCRKSHHPPAAAATAAAAADAAATVDMPETSSVYEEFTFSLDSDLRVENSGDFIQTAQKLFDQFLTDRNNSTAISSVLSSVESSSSSSSSSNIHKVVQLSDQNDLSESSIQSKRLDYITNRYRKIFQEIVVKLSIRLHRNLMEVNYCLASALYEVSYISAANLLDSLRRQKREQIATAPALHNDHDNKIIPQKIYKKLLKIFQVPWMLCGYILNDIKSQSNTKKLVNTKNTNVVDSNLKEKSDEETKKYCTVKILSSADSILSGINDYKLK